VSPQEVKVLHKAEVIVSWVEAKIFANFMMKQVEAFEKKNGAITFPSTPDLPEAVNPFGPDSGKKLIHSRTTSEGTKFTESV
jgi:hypothetical protein